MRENSTFDLGSGASILHFADSAGASGKLLTITDWSGLVIGGGTDQIFFGSSASGLTSAQLSEIQFDLGGGVFSAAMLLSNGELVPVPEPGTWAAGLLTAAALVYTQRRLRKSRAT